MPEKREMLIEVDEKVKRTLIESEETELETGCIPDKEEEASEENED